MKQQPDIAFAAAADPAAHGFSHKGYAVMCGTDQRPRYVRDWPFLVGEGAGVLFTERADRAQLMPLRFAQMVAERVKGVPCEILESRTETLARWGEHWPEAPK